MFRRIVERPIAVMMLSLAAALFGVLAYQQLPIALMPPLAYPTLTIQTQYEGAAPEEVESELTQPIEERLSTLEGLISMQSRSRAGVSEITLELRWGTSLESALQRVYERLDRMRFPPEVDPPIVLRYDPTLDPLLVLSLSPSTTQREISEETERDDQGEDELLSDQASLASDRSRRSSLVLTRQFAEETLAPLLYQVEGVAAVKVTGGDRPHIEVALQRDALQRLGLTVDEVTQALTAAHVNQAGGLLHTDNGDILIRTLSEINSLEELQSLVIRRAGGAGEVRAIVLRDIARVERRFVERTSWVQLNQTPAVRVQIYRQVDSDLVEVSQKVRRLLFGKNQQTNAEQRLKIPHPKGLQAALISDQARFIERALTEVNQAIALGGLLAILILYAFLASWSQTLIVAIAIPLSVILAFIPLQLAGVSLNLMSLGGLALGVGMLVDNAVVVLESISRRREQGESAPQAAEYGVSEVGSAVFASTLTTVAVFAPVAFMEGFAGQVFRDLALTVVSALIASLGVALVVVPTLAARFGVRTSRVKTLMPDTSEGDTSEGDADPLSSAPRLRLDQWSRWRAQLKARSGFSKLWSLLSIPLVHTEWSLSVIAVNTVVTLGIIITLLKWTFAPLIWVIALPMQLLSRLTTSAYQVLTRWYLYTLCGVTRYPVIVLGSVGLLVWLSYQASQRINRVLLPEVSQGILIAELDYPVGTTLEGVQRRVQPWIQRLTQHQAIARVDLLVGQDESTEQPGERREPHQARLSIQLNSSEKEELIRALLRRWGAREAGAQLKISRPSLLNMKPPLRLVIYGQDLEELRQAESQVIHILRTLPELSDLKRTFGQGFPEIKVVYDHVKLARRGMTPRAVAQQLKHQLNGREALEFIWSGERLPVRVRADYAEKLQRDDLSQLPINVAQEASPTLPLASFARLKTGEGPAEIRHVDSTRAAIITAQLPPDQLEEVVKRLAVRLKSEKFPSTVEVKIAGQEREVAESSQELIAVLGISLFLVFVVMATQFESVRIPLLIMGSVPLALLGVIFGLWSTHTPLSVVVFVGMITLSGVVVNNAIVFLDAAQRARQAPLSLEVNEAVYWAGARRLRPILMTTLTTLFGLIPMLISTGEGAELRSPLALTLIFGLASSTLLVLYVIPALYKLFAPSHPT